MRGTSAQQDKARPVSRETFHNWVVEVQEVKWREKVSESFGLLDGAEARLTEGNAPGFRVPK